MDESIITPIAGFHQVAYVTTDFSRALKVFGEVHRARQFMELRNMRFPTGPGREAQCHIGLAYVGATELEVIEPVAGDVQVYRDFLPRDGFAIRFHHISRFMPTREEFDAQVATFRAMGKAMPIVGELSEIGSYFYADFRHELGHYVEGITLTEKGREWVKTIPRN
jgi:hypothetical protein